MATPRQSLISLPTGFYSTEEYFSDPQKFKCLDGWLGRKIEHLYDGIKVESGVASLVPLGEGPKPEVVQAVPVSVPTPTPKEPAKKRDKGLWSMSTKDLRTIAKKHGVDWPVGVKKQHIVKHIGAAVKAAESAE